MPWNRDNKHINVKGCISLVEKWNLKVKRLFKIFMEKMIVSGTSFCCFIKWALSFFILSVHDSTVWSLVIQCIRWQWNITGKPFVWVKEWNIMVHMKALAWLKERKMLSVLGSISQFTHTSNFIYLFQIDETLFCFWNLNAHGNKLWHLKCSLALKGVEKDEETSHISET